MKIVVERAQTLEPIARFGISVRMIYRIVPASMAIDRPVLPIPGSKAGEFERINDALQWVAGARSNSAILMVEESAGPGVPAVADPEAAARSVG